MNVLRHAGVAAASVLFTLGALVAYSMVRDAMRAPNGKLPTAFSELVAEVRAGHVDSMEVHGQRYVYRLQGSPKPREALGPKASDAEVRAFFHPQDATLPSPKISFE